MNIKERIITENDIEANVWHSSLDRWIDELSCNGTKMITENTLSSLPNVDVEGTLKYFNVFGDGVCDCQIFALLNEILWESEINIAENNQN